MGQSLDKNCDVFEKSADKDDPLPESENREPAASIQNSFKKEFKTLKRLLHARKCYKFNFNTDCDFPKCSEYKKILLHFSHCYLGDDCTEYKTVTKMISHWLYCVKIDCELCMPFKRSNRKVLEYEDLKVSFRPSARLDFKAKLLYFDSLKSEVTVVVNISNVYLSSHIEFETQFMFNNFPWTLRVYQRKEEDKKIYTEIICNQNSELPFWHFDCICEFRYPTILYVYKFQNRFHKKKNSLALGTNWKSTITNTTHSRNFIIEIYLTSVTFEEICHTEPYPHLDEDYAHNSKLLDERHQIWGYQMM